MASSYDVVIVGAGITGSSLAYFMRKKGVERVLLLEKGGVAAGGTGKSAGIVRTFYTVPLMARIATEAVRLFKRLPEELGRTGGFVHSGFIQLVPEDWKDVIGEKVAMQRSFGNPTDFIDRAEWEQRFPWLNRDGVHAIVFLPDAGYADPVQMTEAFFDAFVAGGGEARLKTPVRGLTREGDRVTGVMLDEGPVAAGIVVNAAGPWAKFLAESAGLDLPMRAVREQDSVWEVRPDRPMPTTPVSNPIDAAYLRPLGGRRWLIGRAFPKPYYDVDPYNYKLTSDNDFVLDLLERMSRRVPPLAGARLIDSYAALYDVTPDWMPFMGPRRGIAGYADACGGSGHGFKIGPILARELTDWLIDGVVADDFRQLGYDRIPDGNPFRQSFGGNRG